jgi:uncharacterized protein (DUF1501 family)
MNRRDFLALAAAAALPSSPAWAAAAEGGPSRLIVVMLRGAVDGLNVVVPYSDAAYYEMRPSIAIPKPGAADGALALDGQFALHPALGGLMPLWQDKKLAFVQAAGSPDPSRSHFDAQLFIENGTPGKRATQDGWMNRLLAALPGPHGPADALALGPVLPFILTGRLAAANLPLGPAAGGKLAIDRPEVAEAFDRLYSGDDAQSRAYREGRSARSELTADMASEQQMADSGAPPANSFPATAGRLAHLIAQDRRIRLAFVALGGWDTHVGQGNQKGQLANRLQPLGDGLAAFAKSLGRDWDDTLVVVVSEFGRTARENGNGGTDHGHGNAMWLLGGKVNGGRVYGEWPGLGPSQLHEARDLAVTTDYRAVLAAVLARHLRIADSSLAEIFPGMPPSRANLAALVGA